MAAPRHPFSVIFLLHIALEAPIAIQGVWSPLELPFIQLNNTTLVITKVSRDTILERALWSEALLSDTQLYSALVLASCLMSLLCFGLPGACLGLRNTDQETDLPRSMQNSCPGNALWR
ncbi:hypothetical protein H0H92_002728 [Tricholoma furcatifolium]|nr:hypothetical protein H0H92_002728 [Tricholoma furcatifolium]